MTNDKHSLWFAPILLVVAVTVALGATASISAHATEISLADEKKIKIRKKEEHGLKKQVRSYNQQAKVLAKQYKKTAKLVERQGGDPRPLLDAAAYFEGQSKI